MVDSLLVISIESLLFCRMDGDTIIIYLKLVPSREVSTEFKYFFSFFSNLTCIWAMQVLVTAWCHSRRIEGQTVRCDDGATTVKSLSTYCSVILLCFRLAICVPKDNQPTALVRVQTEVEHCTRLTEREDSHVLGCRANCPQLCCQQAPLWFQ